MRTPSNASQAFAEASEWDMGQIPQILSTMDGISLKGLPSVNFSNPLNWVT